VSGRLTRNFSLLLLGVAVFVLLIACANVANLQFARVTTRGRELAVRAALGASRWRLGRQLIVESVLIALIGVTACLFFAMWAVDLIQVSMPAGTRVHLPAWHPLRLNTHALAYTLLLAISSGFIAGLAAAWVGARGTLVDTLREGTRSITGGRHRIKGALVVCQLVLALVLLAGAGLMIRGFTAIAQPLPGTHPEQVLTFRLTLPESKYPDRVHRAVFSERLLERLRALLEARPAGLSSTLPYSGNASSTSVVVDTQPEPKPSERPGARYQAVSPGLFATVGTPIRRGRDFTDADRWGTPDVAIVNETFVRRFMPDHDPIGRRVRVARTRWGGSPSLSWCPTCSTIGSIVRRGRRCSGRSHRRRSSRSSWRSECMGRRSRPSRTFAPRFAASTAISPSQTSHPSRG
jgi:putative ABC transport system permease protein